MKLGRDFAVGLGGSLISMVAALATTPFLIRILGVEAYGLIGFSAALQGCLLLLDLGLAPTIAREMARASVGPTDNVRNLLRSIAWIYWTAALIIGLALAAAAPVIARHWLNLGKLDPTTASTALALMAVQLAARWPSGLYMGALNGCRRMMTSSAISTVYYVVTNLGAVAVLKLWEPTLATFFIWQAVSALLYTLALQAAAWAAVGGARGARFDMEDLRRIWRFSAGVSGIALASVVITQADKLILSRMISLQTFGYYMLAVLGASTLYRVMAPLFNVIYPRFSELVVAGDEDRLQRLYRVASNIFATVWFPGIMGFMICSRPLLTLWTGDNAVAAQAAPLLSLLVLGTGIHGVMYFPYALQLAFGATRLILRIHVLLVIVQTPLVIALSLTFGATGAAAAWVALYAIYFAIGTALAHRGLRGGIGGAWLKIDIGRPLLATLPFGLLGWYLLPTLSAQPALEVGVCGALSALAVALGLAISPYRIADIRSAMAN